MVYCYIWRWLTHSILLLLSLLLLLLAQTSADLASPIRRCHSCASLSYLNVWSQLMQVYFPPMNYTDHCWDPVFDMGSVACTTACITMVEQIITENCKCSYYLHIYLFLLHLMRSFCYVYHYLVYKCFNYEFAA